MITENATGFFEQRELLFSSMAENSLTEVIFMVSANGDVIYSTPITPQILTSTTVKTSTFNTDVYDVNRYMMQSESAFQEAIANPGLPVIHPIDVLRNDGTSVHLESSHINMLHVKDVNAILVIDRVITQASLAEKELKEGEEIFRLLIENVKEYAIFQMDPRGNVLTWNLGAEHMMGYSAKEIIGKHFSVFYTDEEIIDSLPGKHLKITNENGRYENEGWRVCKEGALFWADESFSALYGDRGNLRGYVKITRDITERKKLEEKALLLNRELEERRERKNDQLQVAHKELETFSYSVSHDLRAPLRAISGFSMILQEDFSMLLDEEGNRILNKIIASSNRMGCLIDDLLAFSRIGRLDVKRHTISMQSLVESSIEELVTEKIRERYEVLIHPIPDCMGDGSMMKQVWLNLVENAIKYSSKNPHPSIEIGYQEEATMHIYFIRDNGIGFDMQYADKLFGVFQRLHHTDQFEGTGLGLALVQRIIHKHNGSVSAEASPDNGATFSFKLPKLIS